MTLFITFSRKDDIDTKELPSLHMARPNNLALLRWRKCHCSFQLRLQLVAGHGKATTFQLVEGLHCWVFIGASPWLKRLVLKEPEVVKETSRWGFPLTIAHSARFFWSFSVALCWLMLRSLLLPSFTLGIIQKLRTRSGGFGRF